MPSPQPERPVLAFIARACGLRPSLCTHSLAQPTARLTRAAISRLTLRARCLLSLACAAIEMCSMRGTEMSEQRLSTSSTLIESLSSSFSATLRSWCEKGQALRTAVGRDLVPDIHFGSTDDDRLQAQSVREDMLKEPGLKPIFVKVDSKTNLVLVNPQSDTAGTLFCELHARGLLGSDDGTMQFGGRVLDVGRTLVSYGVNAISTITFVRRARAGVPMIGQDKLSVCLTSALKVLESPLTRFLIAPDDVCTGRYLEGLVPHLRSARDWQHGRAL